MRRRCMKICINGDLEQRLINLAAARKMELETLILELINFSLPLEELYEVDKQKEKAPEQV